MLLFSKDGRMHIADPNAKGFPHQPYMVFDDVFEKDEVGLVSVLLSEDFARGTCGCGTALAAR